MPGDFLLFPSFPLFPFVENPDVFQFKPRAAATVTEGCYREVNCLWICRNSPATRADISASGRPRSLMSTSAVR